MIVGTGNQNSGLLHADGLDKVEILLGSADPGGDFRELKTQVHAFFHGLTVIFRIDEKLALADQTLGAAQTAHQLVQIDDLLGGEGRAGLLPVTEGGIRDPDLFGHIHRNDTMVKSDLWNIHIVEHLAEQLGFRNILYRIFIVSLFQQMSAVVKYDLFYAWASWGLWIRV